MQCCFFIKLGAGGTEKALMSNNEGRVKYVMLQTYYEIAYNYFK